MILYEDAQLVVCCKPRGVLSAADSSGQESMASLLAPRTVFPVHRLDRDVPGVMVFAKTREAAAFLSAHLTAGKEYLALAEGAPCKEPEELYDLLFHDRARNKTYVVRRTRAGVREARLICTPLRLLPDGRAALHLQLLTGRTHQIRVQLGSRGCLSAATGNTARRPRRAALPSMPGGCACRTRTGAASRSACRRSCCRRSCRALRKTCKSHDFIVY